MKIVPALFFIAIGVWAAFSYPEQMQQVYQYLLLGIDWATQAFNDLTNG